MSIIIPEKIKIKLYKNTLKNNSIIKEYITLKKILIEIHAFAEQKNDYYLGPFASNNSGEIIIYKNDILDEAKETVKWGIMDYRPFEECFPLIEIHILSRDEVTKRMNFITENKLNNIKHIRFGEYKDLYNLYSESVNSRFKESRINGITQNRSMWDCICNEVNYELHLPHFIKE